jgi:uncharacterized protein (TIGR00730 family)
MDTARQLGRNLAARRIGLVRGGATAGPIHTLTETVLSAGGEVIGVVPDPTSAQDMANPGVADLRLVRPPCERRIMKAELSDGFVALPGGLDTLHELFATWSLASAGGADKPCALYNLDGFYDGMIAFLRKAALAGFADPAFVQRLVIDDTVGGLLAKLQGYRPRADTSGWDPRVEILAPGVLEAAR